MEKERELGWWEIEIKSRMAGEELGTTNHHGIPLGCLLPEVLYLKELSKTASDK